MDYTWKNLTSREFEIVACNLAHDMFPAYEWKLTNSTRDDNHDFYANTGIGGKWGEAKHSQTYNRTISRSQWDPTLVSAKLINTVNDILLITCAYIPLPYVVRSFHMTVSPITNIYCINRLILNEWYSQKENNLSGFNTDASITSISQKIERHSINSLYSNEVKLFIFDDIEKNYLTILKKIVPNTGYTVNIALFVANDSMDFKIKLGEYISIIDNVVLKNLSYIDKKGEITRISKNSFECKVSKGYSVIEFHIIASDSISSYVTNPIEYTLGSLNGFSNVIIECPQTIDKDLLVKIEKKIKNNEKQNKIITTAHISPYSLSRYDFKFVYIRFDERYNFNNTQLCRLFSHIIIGIDFQELDESSLKDNLYLCNYPEYFENIILGIYSDSLLSNCLELGLDKIEALLLYDKAPQNVIYILEDIFKLKDDQKSILGRIQRVFSEMKNHNFIIFQKSEKEISNINFTDEIALIGIFETGIKYEYIDNQNLSENEELVRMDIDEALYFPSNKMNIIEVKSFILNKEEEEIEAFFYKVIDIVKKQRWSSRVLDFMLLIEDSIPSNIFLKIVRLLRNEYYLHTDFNTAYHYSKILCRYENESREQYIEDKYMEADELNHCGSISESRKLFSELAEEISKREDTVFQNKGLEALTEVYNISFWLLDVKNLEQEIEKTIKTYFPNGVDIISKERDLYPYYNCLNRKMVVQYLLGHYSDAEKTFRINLDIVKLENYIAFAYMDSARGLYYKDIYEAYKRIKIAIEYLGPLFGNGKEIRRYYDCLIEKAYVEFILAKQNERSLKLQELNNAIYNAKKYGYKSIIQKSYFKLTACFIVLGDMDGAKYYLEKITSNPYFSESPRNKLMYNELMKGYYHLLNQKLYAQNNPDSDFCNTEQSIEFNCFKDKKSNKYFIETRMW